jgi:hypothetical protein
MRKRKYAAAVAAVASLVAATGATAASTEEIYADGQTYTINTSAATHPVAPDGMLTEAAPFYIIGFPVAPGTTGPITLPSGYQPQHNGAPPSPIPYHDHITADLQNPLRRVVQLRYSWAYAYSPSFVPLTSVSQLPLAAATGKLDVLNPGAPNPYERWTNTVLVRPVIS